MFGNRLRIGLPLTLLALAAFLLSIPATASARMLADPVSSPAPHRSSVIVSVTPDHLGAARASLESLGGFIKKRYRWNAYLVSAPEGMSSGTFATKARAIPGVRYAVGNATVHAMDASPDVFGVGPSAAPIAGAAPSTALAAGVAPSTGSATAVTALSMPNDPYFGMQWGLAKIGANTAWDTATGSGIRIGIVDSGALSTHPDLSGAKIVAQYDFVNNDADANDDYGHGTHVAAIASAWRNNAQYGAGVAPDARLVIAKVLDQAGEGDVGKIADGIRFVVDNGAKIVNLSLGTPDQADIAPLTEAVDYARSHGALVVAAAGNIESDYAGGYYIGPTDRVYPAACNGAVGVAALNHDDTRASFSVHATRSNGQSVVTLAAPGVDVYSAYNVSVAPYGYFANLWGTSMATPFVAGAAAIVWSRYPWMTADAVQELLTRTAADLGPAGRDTDFGSGRVQVDSALAAPLVDTFEPNDTPAQALADTKNVLSSGSSAAHVFSPPGESDYHYADLIAGHTYRFWTERLADGADTYLRVLSPDGTTTVAANDDAALGDPSSSVTYTPTIDGRYFIRCSDDTSKGGEYALRMADLWRLEVKRLAGLSRYDTAVAIAREASPDWSGVSHVVVVSGEDRAAADPLSAAGLCAVYDAPLLLTRSASLSAETRAAIQSMPPGLKVHIVGGSGSVSSSVENSLRSLATVYSVDRIDGADRYGLAANVARRIRDVRLNDGQPAPTTALVANGADKRKFFDALALSAVSAAKGYPILLVSVSSVPRATSRVKSELGITHVIVAGGPGTVGSAVYSALGATDRWWGMDRYQTAVAVAENAQRAGFLSGECAGVAAKLPDGLTGGSLAGRLGGAVLVTPGTSLSSTVASYLSARKGTLRSAWVFGGTGSVSGTTFTRMSDLLH